MSTSQQPLAPKPPPAIAHISADGMVTVTIGTQKTKYLVHKALLVHHSEYFAKALDGPWAEAEERVVTLAGVGTDEFNLFVDWLYTQRVPADDASFRRVIGRAKTSALKGWDDSSLVFVKAYALGDRILAPVFRREINNTFIGAGFYPVLGSQEFLETTTFAFANIPSDHSILQYLTNTFCAFWDPEDDSEFDRDTLLELPPACTVRIMKRLAYIRRGKFEGCFYEHASEKEKKSCKKTHVEYLGGQNGYGYLGEPRPDDIYKK